MDRFRRDKPFNTSYYWGIATNLILFRYWSDSCLSLKPRGALFTSIGILFVYWITLWMAGGPQPYTAENTIVGKIDILLLGENHLRKGLFS